MMTKFSKYDTEKKSVRDERIIKLYAEGVSLRELADRFGLSKSFVSCIVNGRGSKQKGSDNG
jgi:transposase